MMVSDFGGEEERSCEWRHIEIPVNLKDPCSDPEASQFVQEKISGIFLCSTRVKDYLKRYPLFNLAIKKKPKMVFTPINIEDIRFALQLARQQKLTVTVRNGGHNPAGFSISEGGMVIDMAFLSGVEFVDQRKRDPCFDLSKWASEENAILAQGGSLWMDVHQLLEKRNISVVGGGCRSVGVAGLALGGGIGWNSRHRGLVSDNVLAMRIVLPDGEVKIVDESTEPELMWALRGAGGSNFGVVTDLILRTFPAQKHYFAGIHGVKRSPEDFPALLNFYAETVLEGNIDRRATIDLFVERGVQNSFLDKVEINVAFTVFFDGPVEDAISALAPFLESLSEQSTTADACELYYSLCSSPSELPTAKKMMADYIKRGGPFTKKYSFVSWTQMFGAQVSPIFWSSGVFDRWNKNLTEIIADSLKYYVPVYEPRARAIDF